MQAVDQSHEGWFEFDYLSGDIPECMLEQWGAAQPGEDLQLPPPNPFIATDYDLLPGAPPNTVKAGAEAPDPGGTGPVRLPDGAVAAPALLMDVPGVRTFHKLVTAFGTPRAVAMFRCASSRRAATDAAPAALLALRSLPGRRGRCLASWCVCGLFRALRGHFPGRAMTSVKGREG